jgi:hypothetical protein
MSKYISEYFKNLERKLKDAGEKSRKIDQGFDITAGKISRAIWPIREVWLFAVAGFLMLSDFTSTYLAMKNDPRVGELNPLAAQALNKGGFPLLFLFDLAFVGLWCLLSLGARYLYSRVGYKGYGRAAFVLLMVPYIFWTSLIVVNNVVVGLL